MSSDPVTVRLGSRPGKIIAVHVNYPSRAAQRGRVPQQPSYFLKPSSSLCGPGTVARPDGTCLLTFEGEVALVIGTPARRIRPEDGWSHVGWVTAANDLGLQDFRYADKGSNVRSKGGDGYTPLGPELIDAARVAPDGLRVRTWVDDTLVQDDTTDTLLFELGYLVADLSRMFTLEVGDIILTGTPAGASVVEPGQRIAIEVSSVADPAVSSGRLVTEVVSAPALGDWGAPPRADAAARADAYGAPAAGPGSPLTDELRARLAAVAVATLSAQLRKRGYDEANIDGVRPLVPGRAMVGTARTLRYLPYRKDLFAAHGNGFNAQKRAIDAVGPGEILVMDARRDDTAGTLGDIMALRAQVRGAAGVITDGAVRDARAVAALGLPVHCAGTHPAVLGRRHVPWETDVTVACGGVTVQPGDIIVADDDGAVVIPPDLVVEVLTAAEEQELRERFIAEQVAAGHPIEGLYPIGPRWQDAFDRWRATQPALANGAEASAPPQREDTP